METRPHLSTACTMFACTAVIIVLTIAGLITLGTGHALGSHFGCGDVIKTDTKLDGDLLNCPNNGLVIGADGVTLDLNGHLVAGDGTKSSECDPNRAICDTGVADDGQDDFTLLNGRVRGFDVGVLVGTTTSTKVRDSRVVGVSSSRNRHIGIAIFSTNEGLVQDSSGSDSLARHGGVGLALGETSRIRVLGSSFKDNSDHGIFVADSSHNLIKKNAVSQTATGIFVLDSKQSQLTRNRVDETGEGILVDHGNQGVIADNRVSDAGGRRKGGDGIAIEAGGGNKVTKNVVSRVRGIGIRLGLAHPPVGGRDNLVLANVVKKSGKDAFRVERKVQGTSLKDNEAVDAGDDGFDINSRSARLSGNRALRSADLGIEALPGIGDAGGNTARRSGDSRQCTNVACG